jgi:hypothetical protein
VLFTIFFLLLDTKRTPREEPEDVPSDDSLSSDSDDEVVKGNGWNAFGLRNSSKVASAAEGESFLFVNHIAFVCCTRG